MVFQFPYLSSFIFRVLIAYLFFIPFLSSFSSPFSSSLSLFPKLSATPSFYTLGGSDELLPFSAGAAGDGPSLTFSNPAGLTRAKTSFQIGWFSLYQDIHLRFGQKDASHLISDQVYQAQQLSSPERYPLPSAQLPSPQLDQSHQFQTYINLGVHKTLFTRLHLGVSVLIPLLNFESQTPLFTDERAQYFGNQLTFERWGDVFAGLSTSFALAYQAWDFLSIGGGAILLNQSQANSQVFLGNANYQGPSYITPHVQVNNLLSPFASLEGRWTTQNAKYRTFVSVHAPQAVKVQGQSRVQIWKYPYPEGEDALVQTFQQNLRSLPLRIHGGLQIQFNQWSLNGTRKIWSGSGEFRGVSLLTIPRPTARNCDAKF